MFNLKPFTFPLTFPGGLTIKVMTENSCHKFHFKVWWIAKDKKSFGISLEEVDIVVRPRQQRQRQSFGG